MAERPSGLDDDGLEAALRGADAARPLPPALAAHLEEALVTGRFDEGVSGEPARTRPLGEDLAVRLQGELGDPLSAALAEVDGPRPLPSATRHSLEDALVAGRIAAPAPVAATRARRRWVPAAVAASALVLAGGVVALLASMPSSTGSSGAGTAALAPGLAPTSVPSGSNAGSAGATGGRGSEAGADAAGPDAVSGTAAVPGARLSSPSRCSRSPPCRRNRTPRPP